MVRGFRRACIPADHSLKREHRTAATVAYQALPRCFNAHLTDEANPRKHFVHGSVDCLAPHGPARQQQTHRDDPGASSTPACASIQP